MADMFGVQFYPTPRWLADEMMRKVDWSNVTFILEPSAGKGDLVEAFKRAEKDKRKPREVECYEIDSNLVSVLKGKGYNAYNGDFLEYDPLTRYDLIMMNPPFRNGDRHLLHALDLLKHGGQCVCLLNTETLDNVNSPVRQVLSRKLDDLGATVQFYETAFQSAERTANVDVAMVYVSIPYEKERDVLRNLIHAAEMEDSADGKIYDLAVSDPFEALVRRYEFEAKMGLNIIDTFQRTVKYFYPEKDDPLSQIESFRNNHSILRLEVATTESELVNEGVLSKQNAYLRELRSKYWLAVFGMKELSRLLTNDVRSRYMAQVNRFRSIDFTLSNIARVKLELSRDLTQNIDDAIMKMFDRITYQNSMEKNGNIHYYSGWKSNSASRIKPKIIVPCYGLYERIRGYEWWQTYKCNGFLEELEKVLNYLDSGRTEGNDVVRILNSISSHEYNGERIVCKFFDVELKKKGTIHIFFTDEKLLKRFNVYAAKKKNWLPNDYGRKTYEQMDREEKAVVDSFEGKKKYSETMENPQYYLAGVNLLQLGAGTGV